jgi:hypothetical protein
MQQQTVYQLQKILTQAWMLAVPGFLSTQNRLYNPGVILETTPASSDVLVQPLEWKHFLPYVTNSKTGLSLSAHIFFFFFLGPVCISFRSTAAFKAYCAYPKLLTAQIHYPCGSYKETKVPK